MLISLVIPVFALLVIGGIIWVIIEGIVHISKKNKAIDNFLNQVNKVSETYKFATAFLFLILATAGISQFYLYYIVSVFLFWLVILTFGIAGIIFLMPYGLCFLPLYKQKKKKQTFKKYMVYTTIGLSICLGLSLVLVHTTKIYMDEGGVRYYYGSFVMKQAGGYAYLALAVLSTLLIVAKKATNKNKEIETVDNTNITER
ncbi:TPA: hypothetical protein ACMUQ6_000036 [Staphylococcus aureus]|uniref:hypothetical protein n=1 Tax=Staphylococcus aureus TaxID=1280 RepID=UPI002111129F|nr:hypothetical protein [Staphylococcus aureus]MCQ6824174.1 hypothetical protein [Staphylococcus aureus]UYO58399.1 hypothetical protein OIH35_09725 [Staphylococcus aureus]HCV7579495.1 hypothetical protein [Staphylococcus aureus]HCV9023495.1 hypothetical protein [Staphylococcus aureus]HCV9418904.1 hypothetical protein [Staphylococcus aureus]